MNEGIKMFNDPIQIEKSLNWQVEYREVREESRGLTKTQTTMDVSWDDEDHTGHFHKTLCLAFSPLTSPYCCYLQVA